MSSNEGLNDVLYVISVCKYNGMFLCVVGVFFLRPLNSSMEAIHIFTAIRLYCYNIVRNYLHLPYLISNEKVI